MALEDVRSYHVQDPVEPKRKQDDQHTPQQPPVKKPWFTKGEKVIYICGVILIALLATVVVNFSSSVDSLNRDVNQLNSQLTEVKTQNDSLQADVQELSNPNRILTIAEENGLNIRHAEVKQASSMP